MAGKIDAVYRQVAPARGLQIEHAQGHRQALEALTLLKTAFREDRLLALSYHPWLARATQAKGQVQRNL